MSDVFISYSSVDESAAFEVVKKLEENNISCFIAKRDIKGGQIFPEKLVKEISSSACVVLILSKNSNVSHYVLCEINSAVKHNINIIPYKIEDVDLSGGLEFYLGVAHFVEKSNDNELINSVNDYISIKKQTNCGKKSIKYEGPVVLEYEDLEKIGYDAEKRVIHTIEIDYVVLNEKSDYNINEEIEGTVADWVDYAREYPDTCGCLVVNDSVVGYYQLELISKENYDLILSGNVMIDSQMEEFYEFGGEFYCYIVIMPIIKQFETAKNYSMLFESFFNKMVRFINNGVNISGFAISVYSNLLESIVKSLGFKYVTNNCAGGKIYRLMKEEILNCKTIENKFNEFYKKFGDK